MLQTVQLQLAKAQGVEAQRRSLRTIVRRVRFQRRVRRMADASGGLFSDFDRGTFLLSKQLMYFERYGRLFLADVPLLNDQAFFKSLLEESRGPDDGGPATPATAVRGVERPPVE